MSTPGPDDVTKAYRAIAALVIIVLVAGAATIGVRWSYGAFSDDLTVSGEFERAGQAMKPGSDVAYRGVAVGKVRSVHLAEDGKSVEITMRIHRDAPVPASATAVVRTKTLFGEKYTDLEAADDDGSRFEDGDTLAKTAVGTEVEALVDDLDSLLREVDVNDLATLLTESTDAMRGQGEKIGTLIDQGVQASSIIQDTADAQVTALQSLNRFTREYRDVGPAINRIGANLNEALPSFNAARKDYEAFLTSVPPLADHLVDLIDVNEADIDTILDDGGNIVRVLAANDDNLRATIRGLALYGNRMAAAFDGNTVLPDGSRFGYMKMFIEVGSLNQLICRSLGPNGFLAELDDVRAQLARVAPVLACDDTATAGTSGTAAGSGGDPLQELTQGVTGVVATPSGTETTGTASDLLTPALGEEGP